jgi:hypothetical protein
MSYISCFNNPSFPIRVGDLTINGTQRVSGIKTFDNPIICIQDATTNNQIPRLSQFNINDYVNVNDDNDFLDQNTFINAPISTDTNPPNNNQTVKKLYVDDNYLNLDNDYNIENQFTFNTLPRSATLVNNNNDLTTKKYVDALKTTTLITPILATIPLVAQSTETEFVATVIQPNKIYFVNLSLYLTLTAPGISGNYFNSCLLKGNLGGVNYTYNIEFDLSGQNSKFKSFYIPFNFYIPASNTETEVSFTILCDGSGTYNINGSGAGTFFQLLKIN